MIGERRRREYVVARGPARTLAVGVALVALGSLAALGCLWQWARVGDAPDSVLWLLGVSAAANFIGGVLAMIAFGTVRS